MFIKKNDTTMSLLGIILLGLLLSLMTACASSEDATPTEEPVSTLLDDLATVEPNIEEVLLLETSTPAPTAPPAPTALEPAPTALEPASINGTLWKDYCVLLADGSPSGGCIADGNAGFRADGLFNNNEEGIVAVEVELGAGPCPANEMILTTQTDETGYYDFTIEDASPEGESYCLSIDPLAEVNVNILVPGDWTYPAAGVGSVTLTMRAGEETSFDFGWDPQQDSAPQQEVEQQIACENQAAYVSDVTIPDHTILSPNEVFVKTWRVRNQGTCSWGPGYALTFAAGTQLGGTASVPFPQVVAPGETVDLSVTLTAPATAGSYRSEWQFQDASGNTFGSLGNYPLYTTIVVQ